MLNIGVVIIFDSCHIAGRVLVREGQCKIVELFEPSFFHSTLPLHSRIWERDASQDYNQET